MFYYKTDDEILASPAILPFDQITKEEYDALIKEIQLAREEIIKAEKEAQLKALMAELNVSEEGQINSLLAGDTVVIK